MALNGYSGRRPRTGSGNEGSRKGSRSAVMRTTLAADAWKIYVRDGGGPGSCNSGRGEKTDFLPGKETWWDWRVPTPTTRNRGELVWREKWRVKLWTALKNIPMDMSISQLKGWASGSGKKWGLRCVCETAHHQGITKFKRVNETAQG